MKHIKNGLLDPDMPAQTMRLHLGELTAGEVQAARAAIGWANRQIERNREDDEDKIAELSLENKILEIKLRGAEEIIKVTVRAFSVMTFCCFMLSMGLIWLNSQCTY